MKAEPGTSTMSFRIGKAILAMVIALSIASLPVAAALASGATAAQQAVSSGAPDCDHHQDRTNGKTQKNTNGCDSMGGCAFKCFTTASIGFSGVELPPASYTALERVAVRDAISPSLGNLPFRPPRS